MLELLYACALAAASPVYVGVVESGRWVADGGPPTRWVRVPFRFSNGRWEAMPRTDKLCLVDEGVFEAYAEV